MTHFKVDIQLPKRYNPTPEGNREKISEQLFYETYFELLKMAGGIHTSNTSILGSWISPKSNTPYHDESIVFSVLVKSHDMVTITNVPKIKELMDYKNKLKERFKQEDILMVATRCTWL